MCEEGGERFLSGMLCVGAGAVRCMSVAGCVCAWGWCQACYLHAGGMGSPARGLELSLEVKIPRENREIA